MTENQIQEMVSRFLWWRLPDDFMPDGGVSFTRLNNPTCWPIGTNLLTATQAEQMVRHMLGNPSAPPQTPEPLSHEDLDALLAASEADQGHSAPAVAPGPTSEYWITGGKAPEDEPSAVEPEPRMFESWPVPTRDDEGEIIAPKSSAAKPYLWSGASGGAAPAVSPNSRVCFYCKAIVTPANDPFHVHGCNECRCGAEPTHNKHLHDDVPQTFSDGRPYAVPMAPTPPETDACATCGESWTGDRIRTNGKVWWHPGCARPESSPSPGAVETPRKLTPVAWSKERGFYWKS